MPGNGRGPEAKGLQSLPVGVGSMVSTHAASTLIQVPARLLRYLPYAKRAEGAGSTSLTLGLSLAGQCAKTALPFCVGGVFAWAQEYLRLDARVGIG